jgi:hypothetical protein
MPGEIYGSCHCGAVTVQIPSAPEELNDCQCEHCQKRGALWAYFPVDMVVVTGRTLIYCWGDMDLQFHFCGECGCTISWVSIDPTYNRMGVNARTLGKAVFQSIPQRKGAAPI